MLSEYNVATSTASLSSCLLSEVIEDLLSKTKVWVDFALASSWVVGSRRIWLVSASTMQVTAPRMDLRGIPASRRARMVALNAVAKI